MLCAHREKNDVFSSEINYNPSQKVNSISNKWINFDYHYRDDEIILSQAVNDIKILLNEIHLLTCDLETTSLSSIEYSITDNNSLDSIDSINECIKYSDSDNNEGSDDEDSEEDEEEESSCTSSDEVIYFD